MPEFDRITQDPEILSGKPCVRGLRISVGMIVSDLAAGQTIEQILDEFPYLEHEDIRQALRYAAWRAEQRDVLLQTA